MQPLTGLPVSRRLLQKALPVAPVFAPLVGLPVVMQEREHPPQAGLELQAPEPVPVAQAEGLVQVCSSREHLVLAHSLPARRHL